MYTKVMLSLLIATITIFTQSSTAASYYDPRTTANNRAGVHILDPSELEKAAAFVNSSGGDWGYVTVPIRADDRDYQKWFTFFRRTHELHVIPIVRLASWAPDSSWRIPEDDEILHFANFLNQMPWPIQNRYIIIFNEPNHKAEWGGEINPEEYADKLALSIDIFKSRHPDYFILPAALDRAAPNGPTTESADTYWRRVFARQPQLVNLIDGWNAHAYPNPAFSGRPTDTTSRSIISYQYELDMLKRLGRSDIPVFITEVGWSTEQLNEQQIATYWDTAWNSVWHDDELVSINTWLLQAGAGPFQVFSLLDQNGQPNSIYQTLAAFPKIAGLPRQTFNSQPTELKPASTIQIPLKDTTIQLKSLINIDSLWQQFRAIIIRNRKPTITIGEHQLTIEIADTPASQSLGLGHRPSMPSDHGMLFIYDQANYYAFWMKHTLFPLDIIWINNGKIVDITHQIPVAPDPANPQKTFQPQTPASWILETNAGWAKTHNIKIGDTVNLAK